MLFIFLASLVHILFAFDGKADNWNTVNDTVMGGRSSSRLEPGKKHLKWTGTVSLENNGGFCSIRSPEGSYNLSAYKGFHLRLKTDGRRYAVTVKTQRGFTPVSYTAYFEPQAGQWAEVKIPFADLEGTIFAEPADVPPFDPSSIAEIGILLYDKEAGPFEVALDGVGVY